MIYRDVHAIGDSHVLHMGGIFIPHHIADERGQGATAHNLVEPESATDSKRKVDAILSSLDPAKDIVTLSFGEVDCRFHLRTDKQIDATAKRYFEAIESIKAKGFRVIVHGVLGAVPRGNDFEKKPDYPDQKSRALIVRKWNARMEAWCKARGVEYLLPNVAPDGVLTEQFVGDGVHLRDDYAYAIYSAWAEKARLGATVDEAIFCLSSMTTFGDMLKDTLNLPLYVEAMVPPCKRVIIIGMYDAPDYTFSLEMTKQAERRIIYFCGMDVKTLSKPEVLPANATYLCETVGIQKELRLRGVEAEICTFPTKNHYKVTPYPPNPAIAFYQGNNPRRYGQSLVRLISDSFPDVPILTYGIQGMGPAQMQQVVDKVSVFVSFPDTDAALASCREYLEAGRRVVGTLDIPHVMTVRRDDPPGVIETVRCALEFTEPDMESAAYYKDFNSDERYRNQLAEVTR